jgi:Family of unknown function (DUF6072)
MDNSLKTLTNGFKLVGEVVLPGASLLMDGRLLEGAAHLVVGVGARAVFGPLVGFIVAADSFSKSVGNRNLWDYIPRAPALAQAEPTGVPTSAP